MALFLEGVDATAQPCTLVILLPAVALVLLARAGRGTVAVGYLLAASLLMWAKAAGHWTLAADGGTVVVLGAVIASTFIAATRPQPHSLPVAGAGVVGGAVAGWMWEPCVGAEFGAILNRAGDEATTLGLMVVYVSGALLPALMLAALPVATPRLRSLLDHRVAAALGLVFGFAYATTVAVGRYDDLVGELFRRSSA